MIVNRVHLPKAKEQASYFYKKNHLSNICEVVDETGKVLQTNNYYPFGMPYTDNPNDNASLQKYKYNGKELDLVHGLNTYDYGARQYNPVIPSWDRVDPLGEKYYNISPYIYCHNNPVILIDLDGKDDYFSQTGNYLYTKGNGGSIYVKQGDSFVNFSSIVLNSNRNMHLAANIIGHYAREVGIGYSRNHGTGNVGVSTLHNVQGRVLAATINDNIYIKVTSGKLDEYMYNLYNMQSTLFHENQHKNNPGQTVNNPAKHAQIALNEMKTKIFYKTSNEYQKSILKQFDGYINEARKNGTNNSILKELIDQKNDILKHIYSK